MVQHLKLKGKFEGRVEVILVKKSLRLVQQNINLFISDYIIRQEQYFNYDIQHSKRIETHKKRFTM